ncbi:hypothetical protein [Halomonas salinarum]|nr:hypothetical protein [Halomonas salinarum]
MKKAIGMAIANWLRKPENREKVKQTANKWLDKHKKRNTPSGPNRPDR